MKKRKNAKAAEKAIEESGTLPQAGGLEAFTIVVLRTEDGVEPFTKWLGDLRDKEAVARIRARLNVVRRGSFGQCEFVGEGVSELKIDYGPGYRIYFGRKGNTIVVIISGGDKSTQSADVERAKALWEKHKDDIENP